MQSGLVIWLLWQLMVIPDVDGGCTQRCTEWRVVLTFTDRVSRDTPFMLPPGERCAQYRQYQLPPEQARWTTCLPLGQEPSRE